MKSTYTADEIKLEAALSKVANEEGTIQAGAMLAFTSDPRLHTTTSVANAFAALTGKSYDVDFFCDR